MSIHKPTETESRTVDQLIEQSHWTDPDLLEELHVERGWASTDIARRYDVDPDRVRGRLRELELYSPLESKPPAHGLGRKLWEQGVTGDTGSNP
jgi:hypothetical protein